MGVGYWWPRCPQWFVYEDVELALSTVSADGGSVVLLRG